jgi:hypothetical protein
MNTTALDGHALRQGESPELLDLFRAYTAGHDTIGARLTATKADQGRANPMVFATGRDIALFAGNGAAPEVESFRLGSRGFKELAGISHLGPAVASLVLTAELRRDDSWRADARRLLGTVEAARAANDVHLWRDVIAVDAFRGIESSIADMVDYSCALTARYLRRALEEDGYLNPTTLLSDYLAGDDLPVPINHMMVATFFLAGMDAAHRVMRWFDRHPIAWHEAMVLVAGKQGRATAGVTWNTSSVATIIIGASRKRLPLERLYMAPHAPVFDSPVDGDLSQVAAMEPAMRDLWSHIKVTTELGRLMFPGYPAFRPNFFTAPDLTERPHEVISEMPVIHSPTDFEAMITRMRMVLEDPRQLLTGAVTDFAVDQLIDHDNDPTKVVVPGLTGVDYPTGLR